jgi:hypothetical protein
VWRWDAPWTQTGRSVADGVADRGARYCGPWRLVLRARDVWWRAGWCGLGAKRRGVSGFAQVVRREPVMIFASFFCSSNITHSKYILLLMSLYHTVGQKSSQNRA